MGTWTAFYVEAGVEETIAACSDWLGAKAHKNVLQNRGGFPARRRFYLRGDAPRRLVVGAASATWAEVHVDGFYSPNPAAIAVSQALQTRVINTIAQTTSDSYELTIYERGEQRRQLAFEEFAWTAQEGKALAGEPMPLATKDEDEEDLEDFGCDEIRTYCQQVFGFEFWMDPAGRAWCELSPEKRGLLSWLRRKP